MTMSALIETGVYLLFLASIESGSLEPWSGQYSENPRSLNFTNDRIPSEELHQ